MCQHQPPCPSWAGPWQPPAMDVLAARTRQPGWQSGRPPASARRPGQPPRLPPPPPGRSRDRNGSRRDGNRYLARILGEAAVGAARTDSFLGERYRQIARRRGAKKAIVAIGRSILVIVWHLLSDPRARYTDLGSYFFDRQVHPGRRKRAHIHQLEALSYKVTLEPAA